MLLQMSLAVQCDSGLKCCRLSSSEDHSGTPTIVLLVRYLSGSVLGATRRVLIIISESVPAP